MDDTGRHAGGGGRQGVDHVGGKSRTGGEALLEHVVLDLHLVVPRHVHRVHVHVCVCVWCGLAYCPVVWDGWWVCGADRPVYVYTHIHRRIYTYPRR